jgi:hypothetical protein
MAGDDRAALATARLAAARMLGNVSDEVLSRTGPAPRGSARPELFYWPGGKVGRLRLIRRTESVLVITDGLSDPWDRALHPDPPRWTFEIELCVEVPTREVDLHTDAAVARSFVPPLLWALTDWLVAKRLDLKTHLVKNHCVTLATPEVPGLEPLATADRTIGVLLGLPFAGTRLRNQVVLAPLENGQAVWLLPAKPLTSDEYTWATSVKDSSRLVELAEAFLRRGDRHLTWPARATVLPAL